METERSATFDPAQREAELEHCVLCGKQLPIPKESRIENRSCYVEGAGQLCPACYQEIQKFE